MCEEPSFDPEPEHDYPAPPLIVCENCQRTPRIILSQEEAQQDGWSFNDPDFDVLCPDCQMLPGLLL